MAEKKTDFTSRLWSALKKEYSFENVLLSILAILLLLIGVYLLEGKLLTVGLTNWWIFNSALKIKIFSISVIVVASVALLLVLWPFFVPSFSEMKRVSWPKKNTIVNHTLRVFGFIIVVSLFFVLSDVILKPLYNIIIEMGA